MTAIHFYWPNEVAIPDSSAGYRNGREAWILQTFRYLRASGYDVKLTAKPAAGSIVLGHRDDLALLGLLPSWFVVAVRADRERQFVADLEVVQSPSCIETVKHHYIPHWPQSNILKRDPSRGTAIERIGYFGEPQNLAAEFRSPFFAEALKCLGCELVVRSEPDQWHDYSDIDLVLAIRDGQQGFLAIKPATKLFNAWIAGCPALVGNEPAYLWHGRDEVDFLRTSTVAEVLDTVWRLRREPNTYERLIRNSEKRANQINHDSIGLEWKHFFDDVVSPEYRRWSKGYRRRLPVTFSRRTWQVLRRRLRGHTCSRSPGHDDNGFTRDQTTKRMLASALDRFLTRIEAPPSAELRFKPPRDKDFSLVISKRP